MTVDDVKGMTRTQIDAEFHKAFEKDGDKPVTHRQFVSYIDAIVAGVSDTFAAKFAALTARVAEAEAKGIEYFGTWAPGAYRKGSAVTWSGSLWIAEAATKSKPGEGSMDSRAWRLAVKKGADGRDGKDA